MGLFFAVSVHKSLSQYTSLKMRVLGPLWCEIPHNTASEQGALYIKLVWGKDSWLWGQLVIAHTALPKSWWPDKAGTAHSMQSPSATLGDLCGWHSILYGTVYALNQRLYVAFCSQQERKTKGWKKQRLHLPLLPMTHWKFCDAYSRSGLWGIYGCKSF